VAQPPSLDANALNGRNPQTCKRKILKNWLSVKNQSDPKAWIAPQKTGIYMGAFIGEDAAPDASRHVAGRAPATKLCYSVREARRCIEDQAAAFGLPIKWVGEISQR